ncbi:MAG TPA: phosphate ABC transporter permease subunit PstC [Gemmataceae bacterium]|nr:phosphate ABC transporter permease subunit PstC [Gemmataceae bacterium]
MAVVDAATAPAVPPRSGFLVGMIADWLFKIACFTAAAAPLVLLGLIIAVLYGESLPGIGEVGGKILTSETWRVRPTMVAKPGSDPTSPKAQMMVKPGEDREFGGASFIYGTIVTAALAMLIAVPLGVGTAAYLSEIASPRVKRIGSFLVELLAAIPSVVYGFWGVNFLAPPLGQLFTWMGSEHNYGGKGLFASGVILAIMVVPYIAAITYDVCQAVPSSQRQGSLALGATRWQTISRVVVPYAQPGIIGGCFLALGRALGETMAVVMLIGNTPTVDSLPFGIGYTIPSVLATELKNTESDAHYGALMVLALLLFAVTILMNIAARLLIWRMKTGRATTAAAGPWRRAIWPIVVGLSFFIPEVGGTLGFIGAALLALYLLFFLLNRSERFIGAQNVNHMMTWVLRGALVVTCAPLFLILGYLVYRGVGGLSIELFISTPLSPGGGLLNAFVGSLIIVGLASLIAIPIGLFGAICLAEYRTRWYGSAVRFTGELLVGVPSIVVGVFIYALVRFLIKDWHWLGDKQQFSGWAGVAALAIMMIPIVLRSSEESLKLVPQTLRNASHALGAYHWQTVVRVSVPAAMTAIITGVFLAIARIAGETAPLLMTAFGNENLTYSPGDQMGFLPLYIFRYATEGVAANESKAWAASLVLVAFIMILNVGVRILAGRRGVQASRAD